ncbi:hypothetical protein [Methanohalophilus sp. RSK]|nr:hypothetical protein [Methanohalophilus sp. RSK]
MFDKILPQQKSMSTKLGGLLVLVGETMFLFSLMNLKKNNARERNK